MREFILQGKHQTESSSFFFPNQRPILVEERMVEKFGLKNRQLYIGHLITIGWEKAETVKAQVSLYNNQTYKILLCQSFNGIWRDIKSGHFFDPKSHKINVLYGEPGTSLISRIIQKIGLRQ